MKFNKVKLVMIASVMSMTLSLGNVSLKYAAGQEEGAESTNNVQNGEQTYDKDAEQSKDNTSGVPEEDKDNSEKKDENIDDKGEAKDDMKGDSNGDNASGKDDADHKDNAGTEDKKDDKKDDGNNPADKDQKDDSNNPADKDQKDDGNNPTDKEQKDNTNTDGKKDDTTGQDTSAGSTDNTSGSNSSAVSGEIVVDNGTVTDNSADAVYVERDYNPSERFLSMGEKIKYNANMPVENLPSFITQEMVMGALKTQDEYGYPASVTIAQIIQESGFGKYGPNGDKGQGLSYLAFQYNNLFGIKGIGTAGSVDMQTGEQTSAGDYYMTTAGFRVYNTYTECLEDRAKLLKKVYSDLTEGVTDANTFAMQIGSRWATSLTYGKNLIDQMETYDLYRLDRMTLKDFSKLIGNFANPCPGATLTSEFGYRTAPTAASGTFHKGLDLGTGSENIPTYAAKEGTVTEAGYSPSAGNWVVIDHGNGIVTKYMHHEEIYVKKGQHVEKGQQIGLSGSTGNSTGNHLHFQLEIDGKAVDPTPYLQKDNKKAL